MAIGNNDRDESEKECVPFAMSPAVIRASCVDKDVPWLTGQVHPEFAAAYPTSQRRPEFANGPIRTH